jgi:hypothetical protein
VFLCFLLTLLHGCCTTAQRTEVRKGFLFLSMGTRDLARQAMTRPSSYFTATMVSVSTLVHGLRNPQTFESAVLSEEGNPT